jgi:hypothetical protein
MPKDVKSHSIEPAILAELAEKAMQDEKTLQNPYLKALMVRFARIALELKATLETEGPLEGRRARHGGTDESGQQKQPA